MMAGFKSVRWPASCRNKWPASSEYATKRLVPASHRFEGKPKLKTMRRDEFTIEEYRKLHSVGRKWIRAATTPQGIWYRTMCYNFMLIMCDRRCAEESR
jgi:hypothetical protein